MLLSIQVACDCSLSHNRMLCVLYEHHHKIISRTSLKQVIRWLNAISANAGRPPWISDERGVIFNCLKSASVFIKKILPSITHTCPCKPASRKTKAAQCCQLAGFNIQQVECISLRFSCIVREPPLLFKKSTKKAD